jgi:hypothetical protein
VSRRDWDVSCILIDIGNINPLTALIGDGEGRKNLKERGPGNENDMLHLFLNLFSSNGNSTDMDLRYLAKKHYTKCFCDFT